MAKSPKTVTVKGRLSFPNFEYKQAVARNAKSQFPKADPAEVAPDFNLLLEQPALEKFVDHVLNTFLPYVEEQFAKGEKRDALEPAMVAKLRKLIESEDWDAQPPYISIKPVPAKTQDLAPEAVANLKIIGQRGQDIVQQAIITDESELAVPDPDIVIPERGMILPIADTVHQLYGGCHAGATVNLFTFVSGKLPGFSASANTVVFRADGDRFGGGVSVDEDEMFLD
jgi:hypothetical protein